MPPLAFLVIFIFIHVVTGQSSNVFFTLIIYVYTSSNVASSIYFDALSTVYNYLCSIKLRKPPVGHKRHVFTSFAECSHIHWYWHELYSHTLVFVYCTYLLLAVYNQAIVQHFRDSFQSCTPTTCYGHTRLSTRHSSSFYFPVRILGSWTSHCQSIFHVRRDVCVRLCGPWLSHSAHLLIAHIHPD